MAVVWTRHEPEGRRADTDASRPQPKGAPIAPAPPVVAAASEVRAATDSSSPLLVRGTVFDEWGEGAAARLEVLAGHGERLAETGSERSSGAYSVAVESAPDVLVVRATDRRGASGERRVAAVPDSSSGAVRCDVFLSALSGETVHGRIVEAETGTPLPPETLAWMLEVSAGAAAAYTESSRRGVWWVPRLRGFVQAGRGVVDVSRSAFVARLRRDRPGEFVLRSHGAPIARAPWPPADGAEPTLRVPARLTRPGRLVVRVTSLAPTGSPAHVEVSSASSGHVGGDRFVEARAVERLPDGTVAAELAPLLPGAYVVRVAAEGCADVLDEVTIEPGREHVHEVALHPEAWIDVRVERQDGGALGEIENAVRVFDDLGRRRDVEIVARTADDGARVMRVSRLGPGTFHLVVRGSRLTVHPPGMAGTTARWTLRPNCVVRFRAGVFAGLALGEQVTCEVTPLFGGTRIPAAPPMEYAGRVDARGTIAGAVTVPAGTYELRVRIGDVEGTVPFEAVEGRVAEVEALVR